VLEDGSRSSQLSRNVPGDWIILFRIRKTLRFPASNGSRKWRNFNHFAVACSLYTSR
jgi:hypothetical protein